MSPNHENMPLVHFVHHVDTEGPLYESPEELFLRINNTLGLEIGLKPSEENIKLLQSDSFEIEDKELNRQLKRLVDPSLIIFKGDWVAIDEMLDRIMKPSFRSRYKDSFGNSWLYNWHILSHVGFEANPRRRDLGYLSIFEHYLSKLKEYNSYGKDALHWHFHPIPFSKAAHHCATSYLNSYDVLSQIVCRRLIDHNWFPVVNRAGFHTVRPDSNWWLEQWLPFDASNQSVIDDNLAYKDNVNGRFGDWRGAPSDWSLYNPDLYDWRKRGNLKRTISRCLNMNTRFRNITVTEIERAFNRADVTGKSVYVGFTNHDFREMSVEIQQVYDMIIKAHEKYPHIMYKFNDSISAFQDCLGYSNFEIQTNALRLNATISDNSILTVAITNGEIFGAQPFLAIKTKSGNYLTDNFDFGPIGSNYFFYTFDWQTCLLEDISEVVVAANDKYGTTAISRVRL